MKQLTKEEAIAFGESGAWESMSDAEIANLQINQEFMCVPFIRFHEALVMTLNRAILDVEYETNLEELRAEVAEKVADSLLKFCYQCDKKTRYLFNDGRCNECTRCTIEEVTGSD